MKIVSRLATILFVSCMAIALSGSVYAEKRGLIKVGVLSPLSGPAAPWGQIGIPAYDAFIELINKDGMKIGDKTYNFELVIVDDKNTPEGGADAAKKLIYQDKVNFIAGHWSWNYPAVAAVTNRAKKIFVTRTGNEAVPGGAYSPQKQPYTVFGTPSHELYLASVIAITEANPNYSRIGISDATIGKGIGWDYVDQALDARKIRYHHEWFPPGTQDFTPYLTRFKEKGVDIIFGAGDVLAAMLITKQRWEMGFKEMKTGTSGGIIDPMMYIGVSGYEASQGFIGYFDNTWEYKKTKVNPKYIKMAEDIMDMVSKKQGKPFIYTGWIGWIPVHMMIVAEAMQRAGTVDDVDAIMKEIRGGTFDTMIGKFTMTGAKTYGSPIVFGHPGVLGVIKGKDIVYYSEHPLDPIP
ncbi:MAG: ABC transporter substrate-binding protein [bacterium]